MLSHWIQEGASVDAGIKEFYDGLRAGEIATTSAVNPDGWSGLIEAAFKAGQDVVISLCDVPNGRPSFGISKGGLEFDSRLTCL